MKTTRSSELYAKACAVFPGGVNSPVRAFRGVGGEPLFIDRGEGAYIWDADGNRFIDYVGSWGPALVGHAHPDVVKAVSDSVRHGLGFGAPPAIETRLAEKIRSAMPSL